MRTPGVRSPPLVAAAFPVNRVPSPAGSSPSPDQPEFSRDSRSIPHRKAARVLPEPVGAEINAFSPPEIAAQPAAWTGVGASNEASNQARTLELNGARAWEVKPPILRPTVSGAERPSDQ